MPRQPVLQSYMLRSPAWMYRRLRQSFSGTICEVLHNSSRQLISTPPSVSPQGPGPVYGSDLLEFLLFADKASLPCVAHLWLAIACIWMTTFFLTPEQILSAWRYFLWAGFLSLSLVLLFLPLTLSKQDRALRAPGTQPAHISTTNA